jgi:endonuclease/exonuclease/phosphatase family metal-dependent hydrolase
MRKLLLGAVLVAAVSLPLSVAAPASQPTGTASGGGDDLRIVNLNILHGIFCPPETKGCQARDRVALLAEQLEASDCPEVVGLQEVNLLINKEINRIKKKVCDGEYKVIFAGKQGTDTERVLTTLKVTNKKVIKLKGNFRTASRVVLKSDIGKVVLVVTHMDGTPEELAVNTCGSCKPPCDKNLNIFDCQTDAAIGLADEIGGTSAIRVFMGDFNYTSASPRYQRTIAGGWVDTHLLAGNAECNPSTGAQCTSGRDDKSLEALQDPTTKESERIDIIFVKNSDSCTVAVDPVSDADGDGLGTGLFFPEPTVDGPGGMVWVSDHTGVSADLSCTEAA